MIGALAGSMASAGFGSAAAGSGMMAALGSAGNFLSGASSFLGALGIGGKKKRGPSFEDQIKMNRIASDFDMETKMLQSKKYGIHPLTMLGLPSYSGTPGVYMDGESPKKGIDLEAMGQGIDRMANVGRSHTQRKLDELALEQAQLSNDYLRVQIAGAQKAIANTAATIPYMQDMAGSASPKLPLKHSDLVEIIKDQQTAKNPGDSGRTAGNHAAFMEIDLGNGRKTQVPKTDEGWAEAIGELPVFYKYPKMAEIMYKRWDKYTPGYWLAKQKKKFKKYPSAKWSK